MGSGGGGGLGVEKVGRQNNTLPLSYGLLVPVCGSSLFGVRTTKPQNNNPKETVWQLASSSCPIGSVVIQIYYFLSDILRRNSVSWFGQPGSVNRPVVHRTQSNIAYCPFNCIFRTNGCT
ncbi:unnamed protein product [Heterobilharzia americana]|nr:unnamed protein product [Heterobilharzia americana]